MIYLCIPAHNEEQTVGVVLWKIRQVLTEFSRDYQILVADDASTDRTADVLAPYARVLPLTVLRTRERRGYAASLELLLREAAGRSPYPKRDMIVTLQADFTDEPDDIVPLVKRIEQGADIVGGTRATDRKPELIDRWLLRWQQSMLRRIQWPENAGDPLSGFRAYRVSVITRALEEAGENRLLTWDGQAADAELLRVAAPHARRVECVDLVHRPDRRQRPTRATTWERTKSLRRFTRGREPEQTIPLAALTPERVPPPRPLEVERARRTEAANGAAAEPRRRNGRARTGSTSAGGTQRARTPRSGEPTRPRASGEQRATTQRSTGSSATSRKRKRGGVTESGAPDAARKQKQPAAGATAAPESEQAAPVAAAPGSEVTPVAENAAEAGAEAPPKKRRRRRRRKPASQRQAAQPATETGEATAAAADADGEPTDGRQTGTEDVSEGMTNGSAEDGGTGAPKKRRRRGGRRGGRGRRRKTQGADGEAAGVAEGAENGSGGPAAAAAVGGEPNAND